MRQQRARPVAVADPTARATEPSGQRGLERARQQQDDVEARRPKPPSLSEARGHAPRRGEAPRDPGLGLEDTSHPRAEAPQLRAREARAEEPAASARAMTVSPSQFGKRTSARFTSAGGIVRAFTVASPRASPAPRDRRRRAGPPAIASTGGPRDRLEPDAQHPYRASASPADPAARPRSSPAASDARRPSRSSPAGSPPSRWPAGLTASRSLGHVRW